jgi:pimeloyl-ACP methyl ester carboxylesterase
MSRSVLWVDTPDTRVRVRLQHSADSQSRDSKPAVAFLLDPPNVVEHYDGHFEKLTRKGSSVSAVAAFELPGFGFSFPKKSFGWRFEDYAETIRVTLETVFPEADYPAGVVLVAPCAAAYLAIYLASEKNTGTRIVKLVLAQAPIFEQERAWAKCMETRTTLLRLPYLKQVANFWDARAMARRWYNSVTGERKMIPHLRTIADSALENGACFCLASYSHRTLAANAPTPSLKTVSQPTLFLWGELDRSHRHSTPRSGMEAYAPHAQWHSFSDVGHFPDLEHAERFLELLERFINDAQGYGQMRAKL